jgi:mono/diheme cytochrome c family protein
MKPPAPSGPVPAGTGWLSAILLALLFSLALGGGGSAECPQGGTDLKWEGFGQSFFARNCNGCHEYTDYGRVYELRAEIVRLVDAGNMPPFTTVSEEEKRLLAEWVACDLPLDGPLCPPGGTSLSYAGFGRPFFAAHCTGCHSKDLSGPARNGAPPGLDWDVHGAVAQNAARIRDQVLRGKMPPAGEAVGDAERARLAEWIACGTPESPPLGAFRRGDAGGDGRLDVSDAIAILLYLFGGGGAGCLDAMDADGRSDVELADAVYLLQYLFRRGAPPPAPFDACGTGGRLGCAGQQSCLP